MMRAGSEETRARRYCPEALGVARASSLSAKAAKTEQLLEKAWKMFQENEQREKDTKAEDWELHEYHRVATNHPKPLFHSKQPYSLSNSQPRFPIPYRIPKDRKARANAKSPKPALRLH